MGKRKKVNSKSKKNNKKSVKKTVAPKLKDDDKKEVKSSKNTKSKGVTKGTETKVVNKKKAVVKTSNTINKKEIKENDKKESLVDDNQSINLKKMKRHNVIRMILIVILSCVFIFCVFKITVNQIEMFIGRRESKSLIERVVKFPDKKNDDGEDIKEPDVQIDFNELKSINSDTVGWMIFNNEVINNPLVHTTNNAYYLNHTFLEGLDKTHLVEGVFHIGIFNTSFQDQYMETISTYVGLPEMGDLLLTDASNYFLLTNTGSKNTVYKVISGMLYADDYQNENEIYPVIHLNKNIKIKI